MAGETAYELKKVSYAYLDRFPALNDIDLTVERGELIALLGANGSGKSTLLLVLAGLVFPRLGAVTFFGRSLKEEDLSDARFQGFFRRRVGIVFQNSEIQLFNSNVEDEILFGPAQLGLPEEELSARLEKYLALMDIEGLRQRHPHHLSVGEKKRVAIASSLAMEPEIILLDEPTAGLDPKTSRHLIDTITSLGAEGKTIIASTQDIHLAAEIAERVVVLGEDKRIVRDGEVLEILDDHDFLEAHNLVHVHAHRHRGRLHTHAHEHPTHDHHANPHDHRDQSHTRS